MRLAAVLEVVAELTNDELAALLVITPEVPHNVHFSGTFS